MSEIGETSDGYHTFNELYEHRHWLLLCLMKARPKVAWASKCHADGTKLGGWFVAGLELAGGKHITYHLPDRLWPAMEHIGVVTTEPPEWDGHMSKEVLRRLERDFWE